MNGNGDQSTVNAFSRILNDLNMKLKGKVK